MDLIEKAIARRMAAAKERCMAELLETIDDWLTDYGRDCWTESEDYYQASTKKAEEIINICLQSFLERALAIVIKEPDHISSSQSTRQGYVRATRDMESALKNEFKPKGEAWK